MRRLLQILNETVQIKCLVSCFTLGKQVTNMLAITMTIIITMFQKDHHGRSKKLQKVLKYFMWELLRILKHCIIILRMKRPTQIEM